MVGVSFKISKTGTKYCPKPASNRSVFRNEDGVSLPQYAKAEVPLQAEADSSGFKRKRGEVALVKMSGDLVAHSLSSASSEGHPITPEHEASFAVNLFPDGFSIGKPTEKGKSPPSAQESTETLHPYDRTSETLFRAIDGGWLPGDVLEDIPCKYVDGSVVCEVRDYRKDSPISGDSVSSGEGFPVVQKVLLRPTMENIVKDISFMAEESWAYSDLMEIESRILKAVRPKLCLDPTPLLHRLCENPNSNKLNLGVPMTRCQRMQTGSLASVKVMSNNLSHGKKVSIEGFAEKTKTQSGIAATNTVLADASAPCVQESLTPVLPVNSSGMPTMRSKIQGNVELGQDLARHGVTGPSQSLPLQTGLNRSRLLHSRANQLPMSPSSITSMSFASTSNQDGSNNYMDSRSGGVSMLGKRDVRDVSTTIKQDIKKPKQEQTCLEKFQQQNIWSRIDTKLTRDQQGKDKSVQQHQNNEALHFSDATVQRHPQQLTTDDDQQMALGEVCQNELKLSPHLDQRSMGEFKVKEEQPDFEKGQNAIEQEKQEVDRNKDDQHVMEVGDSQTDQQHRLSQRCPQQQFVKSSFSSTQQWQSLGQLGDKERKKDEFLQKKKLGQSPRVLQKPEVKGLVQSPASSKSGELSQPLTPPAVPTTSLGPSYNNMAAPAALGPQKEKSQGQAAMSTSATKVNSSQIDSILHQQLQPSSFSRRRSNSLPKTPTISDVASPGSVTNSVAPSNVNSPSTGTAPLPSSGAKTDISVAVQAQNKQLEVISSLVSVAQRHGLPVRKKNPEELPEVKAAPPSWQLVLVALANSANNEDQKDINGQRSMANSVVGGNVNVRKTRILNFSRTERFFQGQGLPVLIRRNRVKLLMSERAKDDMVEAVVQFCDDQEDDSLNAFPPDILPPLANTHFADRLATQFSALMIKEGYELTDDQVQPTAGRGSLPANAALSAHPMPAGASPLGNNINQLPSSPRVMASQNMPGAAAPCGIPPLNSLQMSSPNALAAVRMPPPGNTPSRQLPAGFLQGGMVPSSKPPQLDSASQLGLVQQQQQHQLQQHPPQLQRSQQLVSANQLALLNATTHNSNQQTNTQMVNGGSPLQLQILQQQRQQQQQQLQRKMALPVSMGNLGAMGVGNISGVNSMNGVGMPVSGGAQGGLANMVALSGMNSVVGMPGISASMGGISSLANIGQLSSIGAMGQTSGIANMIGQQLRPGHINAAQAAALASKARMAQGRGRPGAIGSPSIRNTIESMSGMSASNQVHNSAGLAMMGQTLGRGSISSLQRAAVAGMGPPKVATSGISGLAGQNFYLNQQLSNQQQQNNSQQLNQQLSQQQQLNSQLQLPSQQQLNMPQPSSSQQALSSQPSLNVQHQLNQQQQISPQQQLNSQSQMNTQQQRTQQLSSQQQLNPQQQLNSQQLSSQQQLNAQQMSVGNLGSLVGGPPSPQLSSQTLGSVGSITSSPMELQSANIGTSMTTGL